MRENKLPVVSRLAELKLTLDMKDLDKNVYCALLIHWILCKIIATGNNCIKTGICRL